MTQLLSILTASDEIDPVKRSLFTWIEEQISLRRQGYDLYRDYYDGRHRVLLTDRLKKFLPQDLQFRDNLCNLVVDAVAARMKVIGFDSLDERATEWSWDVWQANRMDYWAGVTQLEALALGDSYVMVDWADDAKMPRLTHQPAEMVIPHYDEATRRIAWASKKWLWERQMGEVPVARLNIYYPDRIEKYIEGRGLWTPFQDEGDDAWPLPWTMPDGTGIGVPIVHFRNHPLGFDFGYSELRDIIPLQDLLNKALVDFTMVLDTQGFPQRYTIDVAHGRSSIDIVPGSVTEFHSEMQGAQVGQWEASPVDGMIKALETIVQHISAVSRVPAHYFRVIGGAPSGESLRTAEAGLIVKIKNRQIGFGNSWEDAMMLASRVQAAFGTKVADDMLVETLWADPESRNETEHMAALQAKASLGVPKQQIWRELGYGQEQVDQFMKDLEQQRAADANIGAEILKSFQRGENA